MQPVYLPWLGYFEQIALCDEFIFLDDVQYTKRDWRNRNRIRTKEGWMWLTIPVKKAKREQLLNQTVINYETKWQRKHLAALESNYRPCPHYESIYALVRHEFAKAPSGLTDLTQSIVMKIADYLNIETKFVKSSDLDISATDKQERMLALCVERQADVLYTGPAAKTYIDQEAFNRKGIEVVFQDYQHPSYEQYFPEFESHMSIIDLLMSYGSKSCEILLSSPKPGFAK